DLTHFRRRREPLALQPGEDKPVDLAAAPGAVPYLWDGYASRKRHECPVPLVSRSLRDPLAQQFLLRRGQPLVREGRRHPPALIRSEDPSNQLTLLGTAGNERAASDRLLSQVEPQIRHPLSAV